MNTSLHYLVDKNDVKNLRLCLLKDKEDIDTKDYHGKSLIHRAAINGYYEICELLVNMGANINELDDDGNTALHSACISDNPDIIKLFLAKGMSINTLNKKSLT